MAGDSQPSVDGGDPDAGSSADAGVDAPMAAAVAFDPEASLDLGILVLQTSVDATLTLRNTGDATAALGNVTSSAAALTLKDGNYPGSGGSCTTTLAPAATCTLVFTFTPTNVGPVDAIVNVVYDDGAGNSQMASRQVSGTGRNQDSLTISDADLFDFGAVDRVGTSRSRVGRSRAPEEPADPVCPWVAPARSSSRSAPAATAKKKAC